MLILFLLLNSFKDISVEIDFVLILVVISTSIEFPSISNNKQSRLLNPLEKKKSKMESGITLDYNKDLISLYNDKNIADIEGINPVWNILSREAKKDVISSFIKYIDVSIDEDYNIKIENINFNNEFLQNKFYNMSEYLLDKFKNKYQNIKYLGICNKEDINKLNLEKDYEIFSYNELTKNYTQDRKTIDLILNKFKDLNINLMMVIDNKKFIDSLILFERAKQNV